MLSIIIIYTSIISHSIYPSILPKGKLLTGSSKAYIGTNTIKELSFSDHTHNNYGNCIINTGSRVGTGTHNWEITGLSGTPKVLFIQRDGYSSDSSVLVGNTVYNNESCAIFIRSSEWYSVPSATEGYKTFTYIYWHENSISFKISDSIKDINYGLNISGATYYYAALI